eukprot:TRINITY_DN30805_c0_g1_i1.p1 TRINITY_DN30805_c0_g1~~TRINITY_DN30805_c0_g1_i1.p1  ORF type:complete len:736 (+),score=147.42 TRINITY_DN30805_c0_g1_i1:123-2330(+)
MKMISGAIMALVASTSGHGLMFNVGITSDMVLQRGPQKAAVHGSTIGNAPIAIKLIDSNGKVLEQLTAESAAAGSQNPQCSRMCIEAEGVTCTGEASACLKPSCDQGCRVGRYTDLQTCYNQCDKHNTNQGDDIPWIYDLKDDEGTDCPVAPGMKRCPSDTSCRLGCSFAHNSTATGWKAVFKNSYPAGGSYTITASNGDQTIKLERITFGDVWFCSGQSNMDLPLQHSFSREESTAAIKSGKYSNIRFYHHGAMGQHSELRPQFVSSSGGPLNIEGGGMGPIPGAAYTPGSGGFWWNVTHSVSVNASQSTGLPFNPFDQLSATCYYFAQELTDQMGSESIPIGLIQSAIGGTQIRQWLDNTTLSECSMTNVNEHSSRLYDGMVAPFINTTVTGWLWYQGENDVKGFAGNTKNHSGYGCEQVSLVNSWRKIWGESSSTNATAPFGIVCLAPDSSEGGGKSLANFRWSQTGNYGVVPNPLLENAFMALAFDLADPWTHNTRTDSVNCSHPNPATGKYNPKCIWDPSSWDQQLQVMAPSVRKNDAPVYMGSIHPRIKLPVGRRLATAAYNLYYGGSGLRASPAISGCSVNGDKININFSLLGEDTILVRDFDTNIDNWADKDSASMMVCVGGSVEQCADTDNYFSGWQPAPVTSNGPTSVTVDLSKFNGQSVTAIRYGWPFEDLTCCPFNTQKQGYEPCNPGACPIITKTAGLPANPFYANIRNSKCSCLAPQLCDE